MQEPRPPSAGMPPPPPAAAGGAAPAPPTVPGSIRHMRAKRVVWPTLLGVTMIVFGGVALLGALSQVASGVLAPMIVAWQESFMSQAAGPGMPAPVTPNPVAFMGMTIGLNAVLALIAVLQIVAGSLMIKKHPVSIVLSRSWAWARMVAFVAYVAVTGYVQLMVMDQMWEGMQAASTTGTGAPPPAAMQAATTVTSAITIVALVGFGLVWGWVLPIIVLVKLSTAGAKQEVERWRRARPARVPARPEGEHSL